MLYLLFTAHKSECIEGSFIKGIAAHWCFHTTLKHVCSSGVGIFGIEDERGSYYNIVVLHNFSGITARNIFESIAHFTS
jgi:hypothetical protein